jgi:hypothetical protein
MGGGLRPRSDKAQQPKDQRAPEGADNQRGKGDALDCRSAGTRRLGRKRRSAWAMKRLHGMRGSFSSLRRSDALARIGSDHRRKFLVRGRRAVAVLLDHHGWSPSRRANVKPDLLMASALRRRSRPGAAICRSASNSNVLSSRPSMPIAFWWNACSTAMSNPVGRPTGLPHRDSPVLFSPWDGRVQ